VDSVNIASIVGGMGKIDLIDEVIWCVGFLVPKNVQNLKKTDIIGVHEVAILPSNTM